MKTSTIVLLTIGMCIAGLGCGGVMFLMFLAYPAASATVLTLLIVLTSYLYLYHTEEGEQIEEIKIWKWTIKIKR